MGKLEFQNKIAACLGGPKAIIKKQKSKQQSKSLFGAIRGFLTADSFMYGPMMSAPAQISAGTKHEKRSTNSPLRLFKELLSSPSDVLDSDEPAQQVIDQLEEASDANGQVVQVSVHEVITTTTTEADPDEIRAFMGVLHHEPVAATPTPEPAIVLKADTELTEAGVEADTDEENSWDHAREDDFHDYIPLDDDVAKKVANQLIGGMGGRFSDDLGINVDISNDEVEEWFLAANFFCRSVPFDVSKKTYKELVEAGVSKTSDLLSLTANRLAAILESTGFTKYGQRVASKLQKLATRLEENNWGRVSTLKHTSDSHELIRQLRNLPGVKLVAARTFLRELRGVWKGAPTEFDMKTKRAAVHLKLLASIKPSSNPEHVLSEFAQSAGIDVRDLEVALFKFGTGHEQQYGECPGGSDCKVLLPSEELIASLSEEIVTVSEELITAPEDLATAPSEGVPTLASDPELPLEDTIPTEMTEDTCGPLPSDVLL